MRSSRVEARLLTVLVLILTGIVLIKCGGPRAGRQHWAKKWGPLVPHKSFPADCGLCHVPDRWDVLKASFSFDHEKETGVALEGAHKDAACLRCHNDLGPVKAYADRGCNGCHADIHRGTLGITCTRCHNQDTWRPGGLIAEHARTRFPLVGRHVAAACVLCHPRAPTGDYSGSPIRCEQCHAGDLARATNPDHAANGWTVSCQRCHNPSIWNGAGFAHSFFPLTGAHAAATCNACHIGNDFQTRLPRDCYSCHTDDYNGATNHTTFGYPRNCERCHNTTTWQGAVFNHRFPLRGPHNVDCTVCHTGTNTSAFSCFGCHEHDQTRMDDKHKQVNGYTYTSTACVQCHPTGRD